MTRQSRPDLAVNVSVAAQSMGCPRVEDIINLYKAVKMLKQPSYAKWRLLASDLSLEESSVFCFADSSLECQKSQCG